MRVAVAEQARLQHVVGRGPDAVDHVRGIERRLLGLREEVVGHAIEDQTPDRNQRVVFVRPQFGEVERVVMVVASLHE